MSKKEEYKLKNEQFLQTLRTEEGVKELGAGVLYRVLESGQGNNATPRLNSIVSVHYKGMLINGREFDNSWKRNCPEAFRLNEVIDGWQIALQQMHVGDHWMVYIPYAVGYGTRTSGPIPAFSTLVFEVKLLGIAKEDSSGDVTKRRPYTRRHNGYTVAFHLAYDGGFAAATML